MDKIEELLTRGVDKIYPTKQELEKVLRSGKKLKLYQGFDPTGTQLHIGHMVGLMKMRQFQDLGHHVIFLIGDGTGQAGDPSGKKQARDKFLTNEELKANAKDYVMQAGKIVRFDGENPVEIVYNSEWLNKLTLVDILNIAQNFSLQQLEERDLFRERKKEGKEINLREFLYPLLQGYDSVAMKVDLELGGTDQTFNMLCGRQLVKNYLGMEKFVMTVPLLTDNNGNKIGKTEGNVIALTDKPSDFYGKIMSLPDSAIIACFTLITDVSLLEIEEMKKKLLDSTFNPMGLKKKLAFTLTRILNNDQQAVIAQREFEKTIQQGELPTEVKEWQAPTFGSLPTIDMLVNSGLARSKSDARRVLEQGGVTVDDKRLSSNDLIIEIKDGTIVKIGKRKIIRVKK